MAVVEQNIKLEPADLFYGLREKTEITCVADVAGSLGGTYFTLEAADLSLVSSTNTKYYVWFDVGGLSVDPAPAGRTGIEVDITSGDSASVVAGLLQAALDAKSDLNAVVSGAVVTLENAAMGDVETVADVDCGFTFTQKVIGSKADLGGTNGAVEVAMEISVVDVMADQLGATLLDQIQNGNNASLTCTLLEMTEAKWETIVGGISGDVLTVGADKLVGYGESKRFKNMKQYSRELVLRPSNASDNKRNLNFWSAFAQPGSINYSGTDLQGMEVTFSAFRDSSRNEKISMFAFGNGAKGVLV